MISINTYYFKLLCMAILLFFINIFYWIMLRCLSFENLIKFSKKKLFFPIFYKINIKHIIKIQNIISRILPYTTCLISAISVIKISRKLAKDSKIIIGISSNNNKFKSHAWVQIGSEVFFDIPEENYRPILEF